MHSTNSLTWALSPTCKEQREFPTIVDAKYTVRSIWAYLPLSTYVCLYVRVDSALGYSSALCQADRPELLAGWLLLLLGLGVAAENSEFSMKRQSAVCARWTNRERIKFVTLMWKPIGKKKQKLICSRISTEALWAQTNWIKRESIFQYLDKN